VRGEAKANPSFRAVRSSRSPSAWLVTPGTTGRYQRRWRSRSQRHARSSSLKAHGPRGRRPTRADGESDLLARTSRATAERTSVFVRTRRPSRVDAGPETSRCSAREGRHRVRTSPVREGPPLGRTCARHGGARSEASGGFQAVKAQNLVSIRPVRARRSLRSAPRERLVAARVPARGIAPANAPRGCRPASGRVTTTRDSCPCVVRVAEVVGPLSGSEKRAIGIVRVESPSVAPDARGREPSLGEVGARKRVALTLTKGRAVPRRQSDPHHVSARRSREAAWLVYVLRHVLGVHAALGDGRCLRSAKRAHLSRGSARKRPRRPPEQASIGDRSTGAKGEATETSRAHSTSSAWKGRILPTRSRSGRPAVCAS